MAETLTIPANFLRAYRDAIEHEKSGNLTLHFREGHPGAVRFETVDPPGEMVTIVLD